VGDLQKEIDWRPHLEGVDAVIHLAALAHVTESVPADLYDQINRRAAVRLAKAASAIGALFVFMSSVAAQSGASSKEVLSENQFPRPTTPYGRSKLAAEQELQASSDRYVILRPTLTYGLGVGGNMRRLIGLAISRFPPPFGSFTNQRSLLAVENMCEAIDFVLNSDRARNQIIILADPTPLSTADMVNFLREGAGMPGKAVRVSPTLLFAGLGLLGRGEMREKIGGELVASVEKLRTMGFQWKFDTPSGLRILGSQQGRDTAVTPVSGRRA
jgi:UDP-glucose 4-epimerase